jgi:hypothetical protein
MGFGGLMVWHAVSYLALGRVRRFWIEPDFHFRYPLFEWVEPLPGEGMIALFWILAALGACMAAGFLYRPSAALFFLGFAYVFLLEQAKYQNHTYLICLLSFLAIFLPAERCWSVDALLRPSLRSGTVPAWTLGLMRFQVGVPYFFGGVAKLNRDWLRGEPLREWLPRARDFPLLGPHFGEEWTVYLFSCGGLVLDLLAVPLLLWRRTRAVTFVVLCLFHATNSKVFVLGIFPWMMVALTTVFFEPDWPRRLLRTAAPGSAVPRPVSSRRRALVTAALGAWVALQVLIPLRHFLIPGKVAWTKEGQRFSWHMKLNDTDGAVIFTLVDLQRGTRVKVDPADRLEPWQLGRMDGRPWMIRQFARELAREAEGAREAGGAVEVHAEARVSLNNRPHQLLIDPEVDLARVPLELGFGRTSWIVPLVVGGG